GSGFGEVDAQPVAAAHDVFGADAFGLQRAKGRVADRMRRQPRDVATVEPELCEAHRHVGFAAAKRGRENRRLKQSFESRRAQTEHDFAEGDDRWRHYGADRAAATFSTTRRALAVMISNRPRSTDAGSTRAEPMPTAAAPARIQSPALSGVTPPVGTSLTWGSGARISLMNWGPSIVAGNTFTRS